MLLCIRSFVRLVPPSTADYTIEVHRDLTRTVQCEVPIPGITAGLLGFSAHEWDEKMLPVLRQLADEELDYACSALCEGYGHWRVVKVMVFLDVPCSAPLADEWCYRRGVELTEADFGLRYVRPNPLYIKY